MKSLLFIISLLAIVSTGCRKESCSAGKGGNFVFRIHPQHHGDAIPGSTFYIEFNTQSAPGSLSNFDMKVETEPWADFATLENMRCGDYFIYCVGLDVDSATSEVVRGGIPYSISDGAGGVVEILVPITE